MPGLLHVKTLSNQPTKMNAHSHATPFYQTLVNDWPLLSQNRHGWLDRYAHRIYAQWVNGREPAKVNMQVNRWHVLYIYVTAVKEHRGLY